MRSRIGLINKAIGGRVWENIGEAARCANTERPLTHLIDQTDRQDEMNTTRTFMYRDGSGTCLTCGGKCDARATRCRPCTATSPTLVCPMCEERKPREVFWTPKGNRKTYCPPCDARWFKNNRLMKRFGISLGDYEDLWLAQGERCAVCGSTEPVGRDQFTVDHDHSCCPGYEGNCGKCVRGILCNRCNLACGTFRDDPKFVQQIAAYLTKCGPGETRAV